MAKQAITIRLDSELAEDLRKLAKETGQSQADIVTDALQQKFSGATEPEPLNGDPDAPTSGDLRTLRTIIYNHQSELKEWQEDTEARLRAVFNVASQNQERLDIALKFITDAQTPKDQRKIKGSGKGFRR